ncbi:hypothetical protein AB0C21_27920 [Spirillospora sp. NPDC049024]
MEINPGTGAALAYNTMADSFFTAGPAIPGVIVALADAFYEATIDEGAGRL